MLPELNPLTNRLYMGASSALNVVAAEMMAKELGTGNTIVTILCGKPTSETA